MSDHLTYSPVTPINKTPINKRKYRRQYLNSINKNQRDNEILSPLEKKTISSSPSSTCSSLFSPTLNINNNNYETNENVSPTPNIMDSSRKRKRSVILTTTPSKNIINTIPNSSSYKKKNSAKRRRSSIGICISSSPTTPYNRRNSSTFRLSPTYSSYRNGTALLSSTKKRSIYSPKIKKSPKRLFQSPIGKFKTIRSPKSKYGKKYINKEWNLNSSPITQRIKRRVKAVVNILIFINKIKIKIK